MNDTEKPFSVMKVFNIAVENLTTDQLCMVISSISGLIIIPVPWPHTGSSMRSPGRHWSDSLIILKETILFSCARFIKLVDRNLSYSSGNTVIIDIFIKSLNWMV